MSSAAKGAGMHGDGLAAMGGRAGTDFAKGWQSRILLWW